MNETVVLEHDDLRRTLRRIAHEIAEKNPDPDSLVRNSARLKVVRDGVASFFFHPFLKREYLTRVLDGIEANGYSFISIRDYDCRVQMNDRLVQTYTETVNLPIHGLYLRRFLMDSTGRIYGESHSDRPLETTITDPDVLRVPYTSTRTLRRHRNWTIAEYICEENNRNFVDSTGKAGIDLTLPGKK